ncbi:hypothetical protein EZE58_01090 [Brevibacterium sp. LS14]|uniref:hypothetical protein n=1 Tax=Brevibacterium sp. LS14 TaxID=2528962 RepID=UPI001431329D|nr:hypothetical protein [Brevibacterium sp. LS14]
MRIGLFHEESGGHKWQVAAVILLGGALFALGWALSQSGLLEIAATGLAFFATSFARSMWATSSWAPKEFAKSAGLISQLRADWNEWISTRGTLAKALMALAMTVVFMVIRAVVSGALQVIASPWIALAIGLAGAAVIASPSLIRGAITAFRERREGDQVSDEVVDHDRP